MLFFISFNWLIVVVLAHISRLIIFITTTQHDLPTVMLFPPPFLKTFNQGKHFPLLKRCSNISIRLIVYYSWSEYFLLLCMLCVIPILTIASQEYLCNPPCNYSSPSPHLVCISHDCPCAKNRISDGLCCFTISDESLFHCCFQVF